uniref:GTP-dependent dephospho-CoA kinase n=2 Tax=Ignisphaera aggregans TaxID=334771 RepID=A0A7C5TFQ5_9CREN
MYITIYEMPLVFRQVLSKPYIYLQHGTTILIGPREAIAFVLRSMHYTELYNIIVVGDYVCETFIKYIGVPRMCIVDGKTLRYLDIDSKEVKKSFEYVEVCINPQGYISKPCLETIDKCFREGLRSLIIVNGEEDLLALASLIIISQGYVVYGIPSIGVAISDATILKISVTNIFSHFKPIQMSIANGVDSH